jgi:CheY-like chemotaxis protein
MQRQFAPAITYYIRKLLHQRRDRPTFSVVDSTGKKADTSTHLYEIIASLYVKEQKINSVMVELERLTLLHQSLSHSGARDQGDLRRTEEQIFGLLGCEMQATPALEKPTGSPRSTTWEIERPRAGKILLVDAEPASRHLLTNAIAYQGYKVYAATNGKEALETTQSLLPDVILLDVVLPDVNGYAVCEQFKLNPLLRNVPILFVSAINNAASKVKAFQMGGVDYITKPFHIEEVLVRVEHQLTLRKQQKQLEEQTLRLKQEIHELKQATRSCKTSRTDLHQLVHPG